MSAEYAHCPRCDTTVRPVVSMMPGKGMVDSCPRCTLPVGEPVAPVAAAPIKLVKPVAAPLKAPAPVKPRAARGTFVDAAKRRLEALEKRIRAMRDLEAEASTLRRMIAAAEDTRIKQVNGYVDNTRMVAS